VRIAQINAGSAPMQTREERRKELQGLLSTPDGMLAIMELYHQKVDSPGRPGSLGRIGLLGCQMIPRILDAEFPKSVAQ
jgi:hypothetical protein